MKVVKPNCAITCEQQDYINKENAGKIKIDCIDCRDKNKCLNES